MYFLQYLSNKESEVFITTLIKITNDNMTLQNRTSHLQLQKFRLTNKLQQIGSS